MARRDRSRPPKLPDFHLWAEVTRSVSPLRRPKPQPVVPVPAEVSEAGSQPSGPDGKKKGQKTKVWSPDPSAHAPGPDHTLARRVVPKTPAGRAIEPRIRRRLMRGQLAIDASIDLHGLKQAEAHAALARFLTAAHARGHRTVLVITGKGLKSPAPGWIEQRGVLRAMLPRWLSEPALAPLVASWETAARAHGGEGAFYVRIKRPRS